MIGFLPLAAYRVCWSDTRRENPSIFAHTVLCLHLGQLTNDPTKSFDSIIGISEVFFVLFEWVAQFLRQDIESRALTSNYANSIDSTAHFREIRRNKLLLCLRHFDRLTDALTLYGLKRQMETSMCLICALSMCPSIHRLEPTLVMPRWESISCSNRFSKWLAKFGKYALHSIIA